MNDEDSLFGADVISSAFLEGLGWYLKTLDSQHRDDVWKTWVVRFVLETAMISFDASKTEVPQGLLKAWLSLIEILLNSSLSLYDVREHLHNLMYILMQRIQGSRISEDNCECCITVMRVLLRRNPTIAVVLLPAELGMSVNLLMKWKAMKKPRLVRQILAFLYSMLEIFGETGLFVHIFKEPLDTFFNVSDENLNQVLKLLLLSKRTPLSITSPITDVISRFFDQPLTSMEKMHILRNTARYISHCFRKGLPEQIIHDVSTFIPHVMANLYQGAELATFSSCFSLAVVVMHKGGAESFFAKRRLITCFKQGLASPLGYFPSDAVVEFAHSNLDKLDRTMTQQQLGTMFMSMFGWQGSLMDPEHVLGCLETLIRDVKAAGTAEQMFTNSVNDFFPALVVFMGRCNELGVGRVDVMKKLAEYVVVQCKQTRTQWYHVNTSKPPAHEMSATGRRIPMFQQAARRLCMLTWVMLELARTQEGDLPLESKHFETLAGAVLLGLDIRNHGQLNVRDTLALFTMLNALKVLFYFTQVITGSSEVLIPVWMRLWAGLHHLLFDNSDLLREEGMAQCGGILMFFTYAASTHLPIVKQCTPEWYAVCTMIKNKCSKFDSKCSSNVMYLANEAQTYLTRATRQHPSKSEIYDRLLVDLRCMEEQADLFGTSTNVH